MNNMRLRIGLWLFLPATCLPAFAGSVVFRVISYMDRYDQPVGIVEASAGTFCTNAGGVRPVVLSFDALGEKDVLATFPVGEHILGPLVTGADGRLYSAIQRGGATPPLEFSVGTAADSQRLYAPQNLSAMLTQNLPDGKLLGVAFSAGPYHLVRADLDGNVASIYTFPAGERLLIAAIYATDGNYYGMATRGGNGYVYRLTAARSLTKLVKLDASFGSAYSFAPLIQASDGNLYGAIPLGGAHGKGAIYRLTLGGSYTVLYSFPGGANAHPTALIEGSDGNLYGAAQGSGDSSQLFRLSRSGEYTLLREMNLTKDGRCPCSLTQGSDGIIYGTAAGFGLTGAGAVFALDAHLPKPVPRVLEFTPTRGGAGTRVRIWGDHLLSASVDFNGAPGAHVSGAGPNYLWATVPAGARSGPITVRRAGAACKTKVRFVVQ